MYTARGLGRGVLNETAPHWQEAFIFGCPDVILDVVHADFLIGLWLERGTCAVI